MASIICHLAAESCEVRPLTETMKSVKSLKSLNSFNSFDSLAATGTVTFSYLQLPLATFRYLQLPLTTFSYLQLPAQLGGHIGLLAVSMFIPYTLTTFATFTTFELQHTVSLSVFSWIKSLDQSLKANTIFQLKESLATEIVSSYGSPFTRCCCGEREEPRTWA